MNRYVYKGVRAAARTLEKLIAALKGKKNPEETRDASFGKDKSTNYNEKFLAFIKAFSNIGADTRLFPKTCHTCGRVYRTFPDYIHNTQPTAHGLEEYGSAMDTSFTMQYRNCRCGSTLTIAFTKEIYPLLDRFWEMLGRESKETGKPLREVVTEFREQCNRYVVEHEEVSSRDALPATTDTHARRS
jgi:hypothetical protein